MKKQWLGNLISIVALVVGLVVLAWFASDSEALTTMAPAACFQTGRSTRWLPR